MLMRTLHQLSSSIGFGDVGLIRWCLCCDGREKKEQEVIILFTTTAQSYLNVSCLMEAQASGDLHCIMIHSH